MNDRFRNVKALTFDVFGTVLDLGGSLVPFIEKFFEKNGIQQSPEAFWNKWRERQRLEQYQDSLLMIGHTGYLGTSRKALIYTLENEKIEVPDEEVDELMAAWQELRPFPDVMDPLKRLEKRFKLVAVSNGDPDFLDHVIKNRIQWKFFHSFSVTKVGRFKPHPTVYRAAALELGLEPEECCMISAHPFDIIGSRLSGYRAVYVNRYNSPLKGAPVKPDAIVANFPELADFFDE
jgi:2-haloacid dehalogenase